MMSGSSVQEPPFPPHSLCLRSDVKDVLDITLELKEFICGKNEKNHFLDFQRRLSLSLSSTSSNQSTPNKASPPPPNHFAYQCIVHRRRYSSSNPAGCLTSFSPLSSLDIVILRKPLVNFCTSFLLSKIVLPCPRTPISTDPHQRSSSGGGEARMEMRMAGVEAGERQTPNASIARVLPDPYHSACHHPPSATNCHGSASLGAGHGSSLSSDDPHLPSTSSVPYLSSHEVVPFSETEVLPLSSFSPLQFKMASSGEFLCFSIYAVPSPVFPPEMESSRMERGGSASTNNNSYNNNNEEDDRPILFAQGSLSIKSYLGLSSQKVEVEMRNCSIPPMASGKKHKKSKGADDEKKGLLMGVLSLTLQVQECVSGSSSSSFLLERRVDTEAEKRSHRNSCSSELGVGSNLSSTRPFLVTSGEKGMKEKKREEKVEDVNRNHNDTIHNHNNSNNAGDKEGVRVQIYPQRSISVSSSASSTSSSPSSSSSSPSGTPFEYSDDQATNRVPAASGGGSGESDTKNKVEKGSLKRKKTCSFLVEYDKNGNREEMDSNTTDTSPRETLCLPNRSPKRKYGYHRAPLHHHHRRPPRRTSPTPSRSPRPSSRFPRERMGVVIESLRVPPMEVQLVERRVRRSRRTSSSSSSSSSTVWEEYRDSHHAPPPLQLGSSYQLQLRHHSFIDETFPCVCRHPRRLSFDGYTMEFALHRRPSDHAEVEDEDARGTRKEKGRRKSEMTSRGESGYVPYGTSSSLSGGGSGGRRHIPVGGGERGAPPPLPPYNASSVIRLVLYHEGRRIANMAVSPAQFNVEVGTTSQFIIPFHFQGACQGKGIGVYSLLSPRRRGHGGGRSGSRRSEEKEEGGEGEEQWIYGEITIQVYRFQKSRPATGGMALGLNSPSYSPSSTSCPLTPVSVGLLADGRGGRHRRPPPPPLDHHLVSTKRSSPFTSSSSSLQHQPGNGSGERRGGFSHWREEEERQRREEEQFRLQRHRRFAPPIHAGRRSPNAPARRKSPSPHRIRSTKHQGDDTSSSRHSTPSTSRREERDTRQEEASPKRRSTGRKENKKKWDSKKRSRNETQVGGGNVDSVSSQTSENTDVDGLSPLESGHILYQKERGGAGSRRSSDQSGYADRLTQIKEAGRNGKREEKKLGNTITTSTTTTSSNSITSHRRRNSPSFREKGGSGHSAGDAVLSCPQHTSSGTRRSSVHSVSSSPPPPLRSGLRTTAPPSFITENTAAASPTTISSSSSKRVLIGGHRGIVAMCSGRSRDSPARERCLSDWNDPCSFPHCTKKANPSSSSARALSSLQHHRHQHKSSSGGCRSGGAGGSGERDACTPTSSKSVGKCFCGHALGPPPPAPPPFPESFSGLHPKVSAVMNAGVLFSRWPESDEERMQREAQEKLLAKAEYRQRTQNKQEEMEEEERRQRERERMHEACTWPRVEEENPPHPSSVSLPMTSPAFSRPADASLPLSTTRPRTTSTAMTSPPRCISASRSPSVRMEEEAPAPIPVMCASTSSPENFSSLRRAPSEPLPSHKVLSSDSNDVNASSWSSPALLHLSHRSPQECDESSLSPLATVTQTGNSSRARPYPLGQGNTPLRRSVSSSTRVQTASPPPLPPFFSSQPIRVPLINTSPEMLNAREPTARPSSTENRKRKKEEEMQEERGKKEKERMLMEKEEDQQRSISPTCSHYSRTPHWRWVGRSPSANAPSSPPPAAPATAPISAGGGDGASSSFLRNHNRLSKPLSWCIPAKDRDEVKVGRGEKGRTSVDKLESGGVRQSSSSLVLSSRKEFCKGDEMEDSEKGKGTKADGNQGKGDFSVWSMSTPPSSLRLSSFSGRGRENYSNNEPYNGCEDGGSPSRREEASLIKRYTPSALHSFVREKSNERQRDEKEKRMVRKMMFYPTSDRLQSCSAHLRERPSENPSVPPYASQRQIPTTGTSSFVSSTTIPSSSPYSTPLSHLGLVHSGCSPLRYTSPRRPGQIDTAENPPVRVNESKGEREKENKLQNSSPSITLNSNLSFHPSRQDKMDVKNGVEEFIRGGGGGGRGRRRDRSRQEADGIDKQVSFSSSPSPLFVLNRNYTQEGEKRRRVMGHGPVELHITASPVSAPPPPTSLSPIEERRMSPPSHPTTPTPAFASSSLLPSPPSSSTSFTASHAIPVKLSSEREKSGGSGRELGPIVVTEWYATPADLPDEPSTLHSVPVPKGASSVVKRGQQEVLMGSKLIQDEQVRKKILQSANVSTGTTQTMNLTSTNPPSLFHLGLSSPRSLAIGTQPGTPNTHNDRNEEEVKDNNNGNRSRGRRGGGDNGGRQGEENGNNIRGTLSFPPPHPQRHAMVNHHTEGEGGIPPSSTTTAAGTSSFSFSPPPSSPSSSLSTPTIRNPPSSLLGISPSSYRILSGAQGLERREGPYGPFISTSKTQVASLPTTTTAATTTSSVVGVIPANVRAGRPNFVSPAFSSASSSAVGESRSGKAPYHASPWQQHTFPADSFREDLFFVSPPSTMISEREEPEGGGNDSTPVGNSVTRNARSSQTGVQSVNSTTHSASRNHVDPIHTTTASTNTHGESSLSSNPNNTSTSTGKSLLGLEKEWANWVKKTHVRRASPF